MLKAWGCVVKIREQTGQKTKTKLDVVESKSTGTPDAWVDFLAQRDSSSLFFVLSTCVQYVFAIMARHFKTLAVYRRALKIAREWPSIVTDPASPVIRDPEQALEDADYIRKEAR
jgi:hypothetical protein